MTSPRIFTAQRRPISWIVLTLLCFSLFSSVYLSHANAQASQLEKTGFVEVFEVSGLLDEVLSDVLSKALDEVQVNGARALILQVNSKQAVISDAELNEIAQQIINSSVPIDIWIGPSGSSAHGKVAQLISVADSIGVSIGSSVGNTGDQVLDTSTFGKMVRTKLLHKNRGL